ncbi:MAG: SDR family NAD(P)-dependent oxidoreductase [Acidimicrobiales bacterium]|nr:SDR family NAD(P)-dependent oxidoreductase [Acidimicrobiales bacterium]
MQQLSGRTAVITGAASGMGRAFANRFAQAGMNVVMSDIEEPRLDEAVAEVAAHGTRVIGQITDVADGASVDELAARAFTEFDTVHLVCNNAGVAGGPSPDFINEANWRWVLDVNLWGVIHGHRAFLPRMIEQGIGHVVNTASMAGHLPGHSPYTASKWAVVGISQGLYHQMQREETGVGISCLCPGFVRTEIANSDRNRPESAAPPALYEPTPEEEMATLFVQELVKGGRPPSEVADLVHDAVVDDRFWIFTDLEMVKMLQEKHDSIMENRNPAPVGPLDS